MAAGAVDARVDAFQREPGFLAVIEFRCLPSDGRMAIPALWATLVPVHVFRCVAGHAQLWRVLVAVAEMTCEARNLLVLVFQGERCLVVIERDAAPSDSVVTACAVAAEPAFVWFLQPVA
jgi:hypothetical protein